MFVLSVHPRLHQQIRLPLTVVLQMFHNLCNVLAMIIFLIEKFSLLYIVLYMVFLVACLALFIFALVSICFAKKEMQQMPINLVTDETYYKTTHEQLPETMC